MRVKTTQKTDQRQAANLAAALELAKAGFHVFPYRLIQRKGGKADKVPCIKGFRQNATTDTAQLRRWFGKWPDAMPGLPTGTANGVSVIDVDVKDGKDGWESLKTAGHDLESPMRVQTPTGGQHLYFKHLEGVRNSTSAICEGVDVRSARLASVYAGGAT